MGGLSDTMLSASAAPLLENVHAETITIIGTGPDAGKSFTGIIEHEPDITLEGEIMNDPRAKRVVHFRRTTGNVPKLAKLDRMQTADGKTYAATLKPGISYLFTDFELVEIASVDS